MTQLLFHFHCFLSALLMHADKIRRYLRSEKRMMRNIERMFMLGTNAGRRVRREELQKVIEIITRCTGPGYSQRTSLFLIQVFVKNYLPRIRYVQYVETEFFQLRIVKWITLFRFR